MKVYGYARVSTSKQVTKRQIENILRKYPNAIIVEETFTGKGNCENRPRFAGLLKTVEPGDLIVFDEPSRMSRDAVSGFETYKALYDRGVDLAFIKAEHLNTKLFRQKVQTQIESVTTGDAKTDKLLNAIIDALNEFMMSVVQEQIAVEFRKAENEIENLSIRTSEGLKSHGATNVKDADGNIIEQGSISRSRTGRTYTSSKKKKALEIIRKKSFRYDGTMNDVEIMRAYDIPKSTFYAYLKELTETE